MKRICTLTTDFLLAGASATQILTKIEKQNLLGDADVFRLSEEPQRFFAAFAANARFVSCRRRARGDRGRAAITQTVPVLIRSATRWARLSFASDAPTRGRIRRHWRD